MKHFIVRLLPALTFAIWFSLTPAIAAQTKGNTETTSNASESNFTSLPGQWIRPDGGYTITINSVAADGKLDAAYANPGPLPFSQAQASVDGEVLTVFFELYAGGYNGSTYNLSYDAATDTLRGVYYQAVAKQKFDIYFERVK